MNITLLNGINYLYFAVFKNKRVSLCLSVCLSVSLSLCLSVCLSVCLSPFGFKSLPERRTGGTAKWSVYLHSNYLKCSELLQTSPVTWIITKCNNPPAENPLPVRLTTVSYRYTLYLRLMQSPRVAQVSVAGFTKWTTSFTPRSVHVRPAVG